MSVEAASELFYRISLIQRTPVLDRHVKDLVQTFHLVPLSIIAAAELVKREMDTRAPISINGAIISVVEMVFKKVGCIFLENEIRPTDLNVAVFSSEVVIALALKNHFSFSKTEECNSIKNIANNQERIFNFLSFSAPSFESPELIVSRFLASSNCGESLENIKTPMEKVLIDQEPSSLIKKFDFAFGVDLETFKSDLKESFESIKSLFDEVKKKPNFKPMEKLPKEMKQSSYLQIQTFMGQDWLSLHPLVYDVSRQFLAAHSWHLYKQISSRNEFQSSIWTRFKEFIVNSGTLSPDGNNIKENLATELIHQNQSPICDMSSILQLDVVLDNTQKQNPQSRGQALQNFFSSFIYALDYQEPRRMPCRNFSVLYRSMTLKNIFQLLEDSHDSFDTKSDIKKIVNMKTEEFVWIAKVLHSLSRCYEKLGKKDQMKHALLKAEHILQQPPPGYASWAKTGHLLARVYIDLAWCYLKTDKISSCTHYFKSAWSILQPSIRLNAPLERLFDVADLFELRARLSSQFQSNTPDYSIQDSVYWMGWAYRLKMMSLSFMEENDEFEIENLSLMSIRLSEYLTEAGHYELASHVLETGNEFIKMHKNTFVIEPNNLSELDEKFNFLDSVICTLHRQPPNPTSIK